ncbi:glycoside hydrolase family 28 protein [Micromonospora sp. DR5-3]|uniref:glycoside hydrolase family 28 protein n=1 Tax=unclassified Micromonospora TaxID=2617518 RepID=UPI0011D6DACB|nr:MULTISPECIES: glycoside hydrolase family 28 protein [unclassified Micromonospora]MCW3816424.1 glycoside hydrolase family 28 protein [Micromonospora sp. DR5-3]TYC21522.1 glycoside hydrolase family 28 protein [Micromonospora sp. MP36]
MSTRWSRKDFLRLAGAAAGATLLPLAGGAPAEASGTTESGPGASTGADAWSDVGRVLRNVQPPRFPLRDFDITDYGAVGDGVTPATAAIRAAIEACTTSGGGRVVVPAGSFLTGAVHLADNVNLYVSDGATLLFSTDPRDYLPVVLTRFEGVELMNYSPLIYASGCTNVAVTGTGTLDGQASWDNWWAWGSRASEGVTRLGQLAEQGVPVSERVFGPGYYLRSSFIQTYRCTNVLISGVRIVRSPMWEVHPVLSRNVTIEDLHIDTRGPNNDGVDVESSRYVIVRGCTFDVGDDCIAIKSGREADGLRVNVPSEDILIEQCTMNIRYGAITLGSEMTGGVRNVFVRNCRIGGPNLYFGLYIKTNSHRGGFAENIFVKDIEISNLTKEVISCNFYRGEGDTGPLTPRVRNVELRNVRVGRARNAFSMTGYPRSPIEDVRIVNCTFEEIAQPSTLQDVDIAFHNFRVNGTQITDPRQLR